MTSLFLTHGHMNHALITERSMTSLFANSRPYELFAPITSRFQVTDLSSKSLLVCYSLVSNNNLGCKRTDS
jgi:hypothetical protein